VSALQLDPRALREDGGEVRRARLGDLRARDELRRHDGVAEPLLAPRRRHDHRIEREDRGREEQRVLRALAGAEVDRRLARDVSDVPRLKHVVSGDETRDAPGSVGRGTRSARRRSVDEHFGAGERLSRALVDDSSVQRRMAGGRPNGRERSDDILRGERARREPGTCDHHGHEHHARDGRHAEQGPARVPMAGGHGAIRS
jgi:hypothetical protein